MNKIVINNTETIDENQIISGNCSLESSISNDELSIDTLDFALNTEQRSSYLRSSEGDYLRTLDGDYLKALETTVNVDSFRLGDIVDYYYNNILIGRFYFEQYKRVGKYTYEVSCVSAIGILDATKHYGGVYTGQNAATVAADIIGGKITYTIDDNVANDPVYGWLPIATRRDNLHQLFFSQGIAVRKNADGSPRFAALSTKNPKQIQKNRIMIDGDIDFRNKATEATVTEHTFIASANDTMKTLFEGSISSTDIVSPRGVAMVGTIVEFSAPTHDLAAENTSILESGVNYAVLSPSGGAKLTGKEYTHTKRAYTRYKQNSLSRGVVNIQDNQVNVDSVTLVSVANKDAVSRRLLAYYGEVDLINEDIIVGDERPNDAIGFTDPFGDYSQGFLSVLDITMSNLLRASATFVKGFIPQSGNSYTHSVLITASGRWTVPAGITRIGIVLISGGRGGYSGYKGKDSTDGVLYVQDFSGNPHTHGETFDRGLGGAGGEPGSGGEGGKIYQSDIDVVPGAAFNISIGVGGAGGNPISDGTNIGLIGGDTYFGSLTSANGLISQNGYYDVMTQRLYAVPGGAGISGGSGSGALPDGTIDTFGQIRQGSIVSYGGQSWSPGTSDDQAIESEYTLTGGTGRATIRGSSGGGAAYGANGDDASINNGTASVEPVHTVTPLMTLYIYALADKGRNGANARPLPVPAQYGNGGWGGNGGGGGGGHGTSGYSQIIPTPSNIGWNITHKRGAHGIGGMGSQGSAGAPGCVIIYY